MNIYNIGKLNLFKFISFVCLALVIQTTTANDLEKFQTAFDKKEFAQAYDILKELKAETPDNANLYYLSAKACMGLKNYELAVENAAQAVIKNPSVSEHHSLFADTQVLKFVGTQNTSIIKLPGFARRVKRSYQTAVNLDPSNIKAREGLALFYLMAPGIIGGSVKKAEFQADAIEKIDTESAYPLKIGILKKRKRWAQALELAEEWKALDTTKWEPVEAEFRIYLEQENYTTASKILTDWLEKYPTEMNANYLLGLTAALSGDYLDLGEKALLTYNAYTPDMEQAGHEWSYYRLANIYEHMGDLDKAVTAAKKAEELQPSNKKVVTQVRQLLSKNNKG